MRILGTTASHVLGATIPGAPASLTATPVSSTQINLSWTAPTDNGGAAITSYTLKRGATTIYTGALTSFNDTGLTAATGYSYTVLATNSVGDGPTRSASATTLATTPSAPQSFSASAGSSSSINLSWAAPASNGGAAITSYTVKRGATTIYTGAGTSVTDTGLAGGTGYSYTVLATNSAGNGPTASASATTSAGVPSAPSIYVSYEEVQAFGYDEFDNIYQYSYFRITVNAGSNNGGAVTTTTLEFRAPGSGTWNYQNSWAGLQNPIDVSFGFGEAGGHYRVYHSNSAGDGARSNELNLGYYGQNSNY